MSKPEALFRNDEIAGYDFSESPALIRLRIDPVQYDVASGEVVRRWEKAQRSFVGWTKDTRVFSDEYVRKLWNAFDQLFARRGELTGDVLDIGGGWGLYREWWNYSGDSVFIVHDPGVERHLLGPHPVHREVYLKAFDLPLTFVQGFGEHLPYRDRLFDSLLIVSTLDHCLDPRKVLSEAHRVMKPRGEILVVHGIGGQENGKASRERGDDGLPVRIARLLLDPRRLACLPRSVLSRLRGAVQRAATPDHHIQVLSPDTLVSLLGASGFSDIDSSVIFHPVFPSDRILIIQAKRPE
jgi:SAM-dependent methyltransferase